MGWLSEKHWILNPGRIIKIVVLFVCGIFTIAQVKECIDKLEHPPVSTHYRYLLNESLVYPTLTICRRPAYKGERFREFGMRENINLQTNNAFVNFNFSAYTLTDFMMRTTYSFREVIAQYGYAGTGSNENLSVSSSYHLNYGRCFTMEPMVSSVSGGYLFYLQHNTTSKTLDEYGMSESGFNIFLHEPREVLTYDDNQKDSFLEEIYLESSEDMNVVLNVKEFHKVPSTDSPCVAEPNYSRSKCQELCIHEQVAVGANCTTPWLILPPHLNLSECNNYFSVRNIIRNFRILRSTYAKNCDCPVACNISIYTTSIIKRNPIDSRNAPNSNIVLHYKSNLIERMKEITSYDWNQFISDVGGSLGFLLGLSVLSLICLAEKICQLVFKWTFKRKLKKQEKEERENANSNNAEPSVTVKEDDEKEQNNVPKKDEDQVIKDKYDYKYLKDFTTDYRYYENNLFNKQSDEKKY